jgi:hypothetical protein
VSHSNRSLNMMTIQVDSSHSLEIRGKIQESEGIKIHLGKVFYSIF